MRIGLISPIRTAISHRRGDAASTLVETIVALGILAVAMAIMVQFVFSGMQESQKATRRVQAALLAQDRMEELIAHRADLTAWEDQIRNDPTAKDSVSDNYRFKQPGLGGYLWRWEIHDIEGRPGMKWAVVETLYRLPKSSRPWAVARLETYLNIPTGGAVASVAAPVNEEAQQ